MTGFLLYLAYLVEALCSSTHMYLRNAKTGEEVWNHIEEVRAERPEIRWTVKCWHWETPAEEVPGTYALVSSPSFINIRWFLFL